MDVLACYSWPGNVRELQNVLRRAITLTAHTKVTVDDLPDEVVIGAEERSGAGHAGYFQLRARRLDAFEKEYLTNFLVEYRGDVTPAAAAAQLPRGTFYRLMKRHGLRAEKFR